MLIYLIKFTSLLAIFWLLYIFFLERERMHQFKRFYLLTSLIAAAIIPALTITEYIYIQPIENPISYQNLIPVGTETNSTDATTFWAFTKILWFIYGLGVLIFSTRFIINLINMYHRISRNETISQRQFIYVLLTECRIPHSFFKYIFFNESSYIKGSIPKEVLLHEETHSKQLHSLDIIIIELLQIVFWFQPFVYILKHHIKLNHEFLADQAVLNEGIDTKSYQNILLQFSSNTDEYQLSSAINYSSIKKRFRVMKTQTSKTRIWLSSFVLLPLIAVLFYSFSTKEYIEKELDTSSDKEQIKLYNTGYKPEELTQQSPPTQKEISAYNAWAKKMQDESKVLSEDATWYPPIDEQDVIKFSEIYKRMSAQQKKQAIEYPFPGLEVKDSDQNISISHATNQQKATEKQIAAYNSWAKAINEKMSKAKKNNDVNEYPIVKVKEVHKYKVIYAIMTEAQKKVAEPWPSFPPPPLRPSEKQDRPTVREISEYNVWAKKLNTALAEAEVNNDYANLIVKQKEVNKYKTIYDKTTEAQKKVFEPWPSFPPPPPPAPKTKNTDGNVPPPPPPPVPSASQRKNDKLKTLNEIIKETPKGVESGYELLENGESHYFTLKNGQKTYYNSHGYITDKKGKVLPPPPPVPAAPKKGMDIKEVEVPAPPPPPVPKNVAEEYAKKHPESVSKVLMNGEMVEINEMPLEEITYNGKTYSYHEKNDNSGYEFFDQTGHVLDEKLIKTLTKLVKEKN